jgi:hypothetical protein
MKQPTQQRLQAVCGTLKSEAPFFTTAFCSVHPLATSYFKLL